MSSFSVSKSGVGSSLQVEFNNEQARLLQLKRIDELKSQIGDISWLGQRKFTTPGFENQQLKQSVATATSGISSSTSFESPDGGIPRMPWEGTPIPHPHSDQDAIYASAAQGINQLQAASSVQNGFEDMEIDPFQQQLNPDNLVDFSDGSLHSQRYGSTPSKGSAQSSNTSAEMADVVIKIEPDDSVAVDNQLEHASLASSDSSALSTAKSVTPTLPAESAASSQKRRRILKETQVQFKDFRARTSIPSTIPHEELARQSVEAAFASRLNPFVLHPDEHQILRSHICHSQVSAYLNVRNRILRLWVRNPLVSVTPEEAAGCAYVSKWLGLAEVAYNWLIRRGYINFGCVDVSDNNDVVVRKSKSKTTRKTVVVVGAGMAGVGCARQLEGLFSHYRDRWSHAGEEPPKVIVLEGRPRIGGRIYSHPLQDQNSEGIPKRLRCTAELGAHIITGFDHGNPLNMIIRGQLALHYYPLKDNSCLYDIDGRVVDRQRDILVERLFNDILDRASVYRHKLSAPVTVEGNRELVEAGRDPVGDHGECIAAMEEEQNSVPNKPETLHDRRLAQVPAGLDKLTGKAHMVAGSREKAPPVVAAEAMGWKLSLSAPMLKALDLDTVAKASQYPTLGAAMDEGVRQYQELLDLSPQDLRLVNWHFANLEYANAANVGKLSLGGWDQDIGNEFEGEHAQVIGGYTQVPRGILQLPFPLDLRTRKAVAKIYYSPHSESSARTGVICEDGEAIEADHVVLTAPLGVLKERSIQFEPELPPWKRDSIERLGYGTLNKVILVYERPFWDVDRDMIGLLRDTNPTQSRNQDDYSTNRGRFYLFWNCIKTSGRPVLIGLMAGDAAHQAEHMTDGQIVGEVTQQLANMFKSRNIPHPLETIVTRWQKDRFARGTYSYVGPAARSEDYDLMAKSVGNLHFAGEATCGTHPATVHGAYISGLRAASNVIDDLLGPIEIPDPIVPVTVKFDAGAPSPTSSRPMPQVTLSNGETPAAKQARLEAFESEILKAIFAKLGPRPDKPGKSGNNPFLLYSKDKWAECRARCDEARRTAGAGAKASRNEIRAALGLMWREASEETKKPYIDKTIANRATNHENASSFQDRLAEWDAEAMSIRRQFVKDHPGTLSKEEEKDMWQALGVYAGAERRAKKMSGYADDSGDEGKSR